MTSSQTLQKLEVAVEVNASGSPPPQRANYAANGARIGAVFGGNPYPFPWGYGSYIGATQGTKFSSDERWSLSFTNNPSRRGEAPQNAFDGQILYDQDLWYARWTNAGSTNKQDWLAVDFGVQRTIDTVNIFTWVNGTTTVPSNLTLQYVDAADSPYNASANISSLQWQDVPEFKYPGSYNANDVNELSFPALGMQNLRVLFAVGDVVGVTEIEAWGNYDASSVNCPTQTTNSNAKHYEAEEAVIYQGSAFGSPYACDWGVVGSLNAYGTDYFVKDFSVVTRGDFNATTSGEEWQGMTGNAYIEWYVNIDQDKGGMQNMTIRYANGGNTSTQMPLAVDGQDVGMMDLPPTGGYSLVEGSLKLTSRTVNVTSGSHRIRLTKGPNGFAEFDYMELESMS